MKRRPLCLLALVVVLILSTAASLKLPISFLSGDLREAMRLYEHEKMATISGTLSRIEERPQGDLLILGRVSLETERGLLGISNVRVFTDGQERDRPYECGWTLRLRGKLQEIQRPSNPGEFDAVAYYRVQGIYFQMREAEAEVLTTDTDVLAERLRIYRKKINGLIDACFPDDAAPIFAAMLTGERSGLDEETRSLWRGGGIAHMLVISGLHLSLLGMGVFHLLRRLRLPLVPSGLISAGLLLLYTMLIGWQISAVRALLMFCVMLGAKLFRRTYDPPTALAFAALMILLTSPEYLTYSGFQMSCCAVLISTVFRKRSPAALALLLYLWMLPLTAISYYEIPLLSIGINLLAVPLLPLLLGSGIIGLLGAGIVSALGPFGISAAPGIFSVFGTVLVRGLNALLTFVEQLGINVLITGCPSVPRTILYLVVLSLWTYYYGRYRLLKKRFFLFLFLPAVVGILLLRPGKELKLTALSVGQGDAICIESGQGRAVLVDSGSTSVREVGRKRVLPFLKYEGVRRIEYVIATHMDEDHIVGIRELLTMAAEGSAHMKIGTLLLPLLSREEEKTAELEALAKKAGVRVLRVQRGDSFRVGEAELLVLGPDPSLETDPLDANAQCVVLALSYGDFDALLTGDVTGEVETLLLQGSADTAMGRSFELLKVAHHGSRYSTTEEFLEKVNPEVSLISCGEENPYGHPHEEVLKRLMDSGTAIFRTDESGAVRLATDGRRYTVETFR